MASADVLVVGLGAAGAATTYQLAAAGARVVGLDAFAPGHDKGSSHGASRITRQAIGEGKAYVPLALRAHDLWRDMEARTGDSLMITCGALMLGRMTDGGAHAGKPDFLRRTIEVAQDFAIEHQVLTPEDTRRRFPMFQPDEDETVYFEPGAGLLRPERCIAAQLSLAEGLGADIRFGEAVLDIDQTGAGVRVTTDQGFHEAGQVVVAAGPWVGRLIGGTLAERLTLQRQVMHWFAPEDPSFLSPDRCPVFIWMHGRTTESWFYGFPQIPGEAGVKVAEERFGAPLARPEDQTQVIAPGAAEQVWRDHVAGRLAGVGPRPLASKACLYTMAPDGRFLIDRDPDRDRVIFISACSGHGFKHSAAIGEAVTQMALTGFTPDVLKPFALTPTP